MPDDRVKRFFRRLKGQDANKTLHSFPTLRAKPKTEFGWNEFKQSLKNLLKSDLTEGSYKAFLAPILLSEIDHELLDRWLQVLSLLPFFRESSIRQYDDDFSIQSSIQLHRQLSSYLSSILALSREYKWPIIRPLEKLEPDNAKARGIVDSFVLGNALLVAPIMSAGATQRHVYLPQGRWYSYESSNVYEGSRYVTVEAARQQIPLFVKSGTTLPLQSANNTTQTDYDILVYRVYPGDGETVLYEDDASLEQVETGYRWIYITCGWDEGKLVINRRIAGQYKPSYTKIRLEIVDLPSEPTSINIDRRPAPLWYFDNSVLEFTTDSFQRLEISFVDEPY